MQFGAHLPLMDFGGNPYTLGHLLRYTRTAQRLGFSLLCANDHLLFPVPWLDGPTALAAVLSESGTMTLATTVTLAAVRGPVPVAKALGAIDRLSAGRALVTVGPGSSAEDYQAVNLPFEERWSRLDEAVAALRVLWGRDPGPFIGRFYTTEGMELLPMPARAGGPPIWIGSWGSRAGLRRVARLGDGWLASAYNTTPELFLEARDRLASYLVDEGKSPDGFANGLATMWFYITDDRSEADAIIHERMVPAVHRPEEVLRARLPIGPANAFAEKLAAFAQSGAQSVMVWPVADERRQLELFWEHVVPECP
jgi:alkanesulfonate monooxygenase SsuD/methylene tetrahydromethanopterin reductase-like flavin-dependent oxidoreductase (luciferase family)